MLSPFVGPHSRPVRMLSSLVVGSVMAVLTIALVVAG